MKAEQTEWAWSCILKQYGRDEVSWEGEGERHLKKTGAEVQLEAPVPELYVRKPDGTISERYTDLDNIWPGTQRTLVDVTVRSMLHLAVRCSPRAWSGSARR